MSPTTRACSNCGSGEDLHFVTIGDPAASEPGRTLLYCPRCRLTNHHQLALSWPMSLLTPGTFLQLYRLGKTESDPGVAVRIVFGPGNDWIATEACDILERRRLGDE